MERVLIQVHLIFVLMTIIYRLSIDTQLNFVERICVLPCFSVVAIRLNFITQNDNIFPFPTCCSMLWLHHHQKQQLELIMCTVQQSFSSSHALNFKERKICLTVVHSEWFAFTSFSEVFRWKFGEDFENKINYPSLINLIVEQI